MQAACYILQLAEIRKIRLSLYLDDSLLKPPGHVINKDGDRYRKDFGIIVRGPNPFQKDNMMVILSGRSSLGTEAVCRAFTDPNVIETIIKSLSGKQIKKEKV